MKFDYVIGNPPYAGNYYVDFLYKLHDSARLCDCWIVPHTLYIATSKKEQLYKNEMLDKIKVIKYYPDCMDVFKIMLQGGIVYFIVGKDRVEKCKVINQCYLNKHFNDVAIRDITKIKSLLNCTISIIDKLSKYEHYQLDDVKLFKKYTVNYNIMLVGADKFALYDFNKHRLRDDIFAGRGGMLNSGGKLLCFGHPKIFTETYNNTRGTSRNMFTSDDIKEVESFISWMYCKFTAFCSLVTNTRMHVLEPAAFRITPDPGKFDHIFTDEELYKKYGLTDDEISIIEDYIQPHKQKSIRDLLPESELPEDYK